MPLDKATQTSIKNAVEHQFKITSFDGRPDSYFIEDMHDSASGDVHTLTKLQSGYHCDCKGFEYRGNCKHIRALNLHFLRSGMNECAKPFEVSVEEDDADHPKEGLGPLDGPGSVRGRTA